MRKHSSATTTADGRKHTLNLGSVIHEIVSSGRIESSAFEVDADIVPIDGIAVEITGTRAIHERKSSLKPSHGIAKEIVEVGISRRDAGVSSAGDGVVSHNIRDGVVSGKEDANASFCSICDNGVVFYCISLRSVEGNGGQVVRESIVADCAVRGRAIDVVADKNAGPVVPKRVSFSKCIGRAVKSESCLPAGKGEVFEGEVLISADKDTGLGRGRGSRDGVAVAVQSDAVALYHDGICHISGVQVRVAGFHVPIREQSPPPAMSSAMVSAKETEVKMNKNKSSKRCAVVHKATDVATLLILPVNIIYSPPSGICSLTQRYVLLWFVRPLRSVSARTLAHGIGDCVVCAGLVPFVNLGGDSDLSWGYLCQCSNTGCSEPHLSIRHLKRR